MQKEEELTASLSEKQKIFEKFKDCTNELFCTTEHEAFRSGLVIATHIMLEVM